MDDRPPAPPSWSPNLERKGGFWADARWYELQLERRMPLVEPMLRQLIFAMPPLPKGCRVCDLLGGSGRVGVRIMEAYPGIQLVLIDDDPVRVELATAKAQDELAKGSEFAGVVQTIGPNDLLPGGPYDVIVAVMSLQFILGQDAALSPDETYLRYQLLFENLGRSLVQGGHLFVGDYLGALSLFKQMRSMEDAGFTDVDCAWRLDDMFVYAGVVPSFLPDIYLALCYSLSILHNQESAPLFEKSTGAGGRWLGQEGILIAFQQIKAAVITS